MNTIKNKTEKWGIDEPKRVYVVQSSHGQYEDHITEINGIYSRPDVAEVEAQKIRDYYGSIDDRYQFNDDTNLDDLTDTELEEWDIWMNEREYNKTWITEFELDNVPSIAAVAD